MSLETYAKLSAAVIFSSAVLLFNQPANACTQQYYEVSNGQTTKINECGSCKMVTNNSPLSIFVPTNTALEFTDFYNNLPPDVTATTCEVTVTVPLNASILCCASKNYSCNAGPQYYDLSSYVPAQSQVVEADVDYHMPLCGNVPSAGGDGPVDSMHDLYPSSAAASNYCNGGVEHNHDGVHETMTTIYNFANNQLSLSLSGWQLSDTWTGCSAATAYVPTVTLHFQ